uniref:extracellular solute-binding protein n=1 Tax=Halomonas sp. TaxID=1486246 RepID=UPI00260CE999|nr:extracellular solute-binding protein [Halomonas sp.]
MLLAAVVLLSSALRADEVADSAVSSAAATELVVLSWGGAYERAQRRALFEPFTAATDIPVRVLQYDGGIGGLRQAVAEGRVPWDVIDMTRSQAKEACGENLLQPLSWSLLAPAPDGSPAQRDFIEGALGRCAITHSIFATVVAYRRDAFPGYRPTRIEDLFDQQRFPGPRALQRTPAVNLEWALLSYGVPRQELYQLLSTQRGLSLALQRIAELEDLQWWEAGDTPVRLLAEQKVVMASGYNGRFFDAIVNRGLPIEILWDGQVQEHETWVIPQHAPHPDMARAFIRFVATSQRQVALAQLIPYGPSRHSATLQIGSDSDSGVDMRLHIPTYPLNAERAITQDDDWYANTYRRISEYFHAALLDGEEQSSIDSPGSGQP